MARISPNTLKDWKDGDIVYAGEFKQEREIIRVAVNDNYDRIMDRYTKAEVDAFLEAIDTGKLDTRYYRQDQIDNFVNNLQGQITTNTDDITDLFSTRYTKQEVDSKVSNLQSQINSNVNSLNNHDLRISKNVQDISNIYEVKADKNNTYTKGEVDNSLVQKTNLIGDHQGTWHGLTPSKMGADGINAARIDKLEEDVADHEQRIEEIEYQLSPDESDTIALAEGVQTVNALSDSGLQMRFDGRTLVNLVGRDGNFEIEGSTAEVGRGWGANLYGATPTLSSENVKYGTKAQRITANVGDTNVGRRLEKSIPVKAGKYYLALVDVETDGDTNARLSFGGSFADRTDGGLLCVKHNPTTDGNVWLQVINTKPLGETGWTQFDGVRLYEISEAEYNALDTMTDEEISAMYPYVDSVQHTRNPSVISIGKNLANESNLAYKPENSSIIRGKYTTIFSGTNTSQRLFSLIKAIKGQEYTISLKIVGVTYDQQYIGIGIRSYSKYPSSPDDSILRTIDLFNSSVDSTGEKEVTVTVQDDEEYIGIYLYTGSVTVNASVEFKEVQIELGSQTTEFEEHQQSYLFGVDVVLAEGEYVEQIGATEFRKWETTKIVELDGSLPYQMSQGFTGYKRIHLPLNGIQEFTERLVKYDGKILGRREEGGFPTEPDFSVTGANGLWVNISSQDSGWGDNYSPTSAEIKAYFMGWKMYNTVDGVKVSNPYNGTGTKGWHPIGLYEQGTTTLPTSPSITLAQGSIDYYQLHYKLAEPKFVPAHFEGSLRVQKGQNHLNVGTGVVVRESTVPKLNTAGDAYHINYGNKNNNAYNPLKYRLKEFLNIHKNQESDLHEWGIGYITQSYGLGRAWKFAVDFDPTASYTVTYFVLDKYLFTAGLKSAEGTYQTNLASNVEQHTKDIASLAKQQSIIVKDYARKHQGQWIPASLMNGWLNLSGYTCAYMKDESGFVHIRGLVTGGTLSSSLPVIILPSNYRPTQTRNFPLACWNGSAIVIGSVVIRTNGYLTIEHGATNWVSLDNISFRAEQ